MLSILFCLVAFGQQAPRPPQAPGIEWRMANAEAEISKLKLELAELRADRGPTGKQHLQVQTGAVEIVSAKEFHPVKAAVNVATAPAKVLQRICDGGVCRMVEVDAPAATAPQGECATGNCSGGSCSSGTCGVARRGWFGRRR